MRNSTFTIFGLCFILSCQQKPNIASGTIEADLKQNGKDIKYDWIQENVDSLMRANNIPAIPVVPFRLN